jgi:hypothetical protein
MSAADLRLLESRIVAATVFSDAAHVTRRASSRLTEKRERVALRNLPAEVDPGGVRVSTSRGIVRAVESESVFAPQDALADGTAIARAVEILEAKIWRLNGEREALGMELALIDRVVPTAGGERQPSPSQLRPENFLAGLDALIARRRSALKTLREVDLDIYRTQEELREMRHRSSAAGKTAGSTEKKTVLVISLDVEEPGESTIDVVYEAVWATWRPYYHVRLDPKDRLIECVRFADLWQETGEDWIDAALRLSTAEPESRLVLPKVSAWTLGSPKSYEDKLGQLYTQRQRQQAEPPKTEPRKSGAAVLPANDVPADSDEPEEDMEGAMPSVTAPQMNIPPPPSRGGGGFGMMRTRSAPSAAPLGAAAAPGGSPRQAAPQEIEYVSGPRSLRSPSADHPDYEQLVRTPAPRDLSGGIDHELRVELAATCPSGKERRRIGFGSTQYPARIEYLLRPAARDHAFGRVTVVNAENSPLIAGPASIFLGDIFSGETKIQTTPAGGKLVLDLGAEPAIKSARRTRTTVRTEGILTKEDVHVVEATIEVENHLEYLVELEIQDQVPISQDARIKVRLMRTAPKDAELDELTGILTFKLRLSAGARAEVVIVYEIEAPKDYEFQQVLRS